MAERNRVKTQRWCYARPTVGRAAADRPERTLLGHGVAFPADGLPRCSWISPNDNRHTSSAGTGAGIGCVWLEAQIITRTFWTFLVWVDRASLESFAGTDPHRRATHELRNRTGESMFDFFLIKGGEIPLPRSQIHARVVHWRRSGSDADRTIGSDGNWGPEPVATANDGSGPSVRSVEDLRRVSPVASDPGTKRRSPPRQRVRRIGMPLQRLVTTSKVVVPRCSAS